jgi:predicted small secreted protein
MKSKILLSLFAGLLALSAIGCKHTANGFGKDMEDAGEKIQEKTN